MEMPLSLDLHRHAPDNANKTPLMHSITRFVHYGGTAAKVTFRNLLASGSDVNAHDTDGDTPLMYAVAYARFPNRHGREMLATQMLLDAGADPDLSNKVGMTALMYSVSSGHLEVTKKLVDAGANVNTQDCFGFTSLTYCLNQRLHNCSRVERLDTLIAAGADVNIRDNEGNTLLMHSICKIPLVARRNLPLAQGEAIIRKILAAGADVDAANLTGLTGLHFACLCNHEMAVRILLETAMVDCTSMDGRTPLCFGIWNKNKQVVETLFKAGAKVTNEIVVAVMMGLSDVVKVMLRTGATPRSKVLKFPIVLIPRRRRNFYRNMKAVFGTEPVSPLMAAVVSNRLDIARLFLSLTFLSSYDLRLPKRTKQRALRLLEKNDEALAIFRKVYEQPKSLMTLCLVNVSEAIGFGDERGRKVTDTQLPIFVQEMLLYKVRSFGEFRDVQFNNSTRSENESDDDLNYDSDAEDEDLYRLNDSDDSEDEVDIVEEENINHDGLDNDNDDDEDEEEEEEVEDDLMNLFSDHEGGLESDDDAMDDNEVDEVELEHLNEELEALEEDVDEDSDGDLEEVELIDVGRNE